MPGDQFILYQYFIEVVLNRGWVEPPERNRCLGLYSDKHSTSHNRHTSDTDYQLQISHCTIQCYQVHTCYLHLSLFTLFQICMLASICCEHLTLRLVLSRAEVWEELTQRYFPVKTCCNCTDAEEVVRFVTHNLNGAESYVCMVKAMLCCLGWYMQSYALELRVNSVSPTSTSSSPSGRKTLEAKRWRNDSCPVALHGAIPTSGNESFCQYTDTVPSLHQFISLT